MLRAEAESAVDALTKAGYREQDISVLMTDETREMQFGSVKATTPGPDRGTTSKLSEGVGVGGTVGASVGAVLAGIAAIGTVLLLPGLGLVVAGPIAAGLAGAGVGGAAGGLLGGLAGMGINEDRASYYEQGLREGGIVVGVKARSKDDVEALHKWFGQKGAEHVRAA